MWLDTDGENTPFSVKVDKTDGGYMVSITDNTGTNSFEILDGKAGAPGYSPIKEIDYWTPADQESIVQDVITALGTPILGTVDSYNNITFKGKLANGTYTLKYENEDGTTTKIGNLILGGITNLADTTSADWKTNFRLNSSCEITHCTPCETTNFIPCEVGDVIRVKGLNISNYYTNGVGTDLARATAWFFAEDKTTPVAKNAPADGNGWVYSDGIWTYTVGTGLTSVSDSNSDIRYCRMCGILYDGFTKNDIIITVNEEI